jgi:hypothetical protein
VVKFGLTDLNVRREYDWISLSQFTSDQSIDLTDHFTVGDNQMPKFGKTVDVIMPWDPKLPQRLILEFTLSESALTQGL